MEHLVVAKDVETTMELPLMSIVFVTGGKAANIEASLHSCVNQTYDHLELIVVEYDPDEHVRRMLERLDRRNITALHLEHSNREAALNTALATASGEYVVCIDAGAEIHEQYLQQALGWFGRSQADAARCSTMYLGKVNSGEVDMPAENWYQRLLFSPQHELHAVIVKRSACASFPEDGRPYADWEFWLDTLRGKKLFVWPDYVGCFVHGDRPDWSHDANNEQRARRLRIMASHAQEVRGPVQKFRHGLLMRRHYREYLEAGAPGELFFSSWWARGLDRRS